MLAEAILKYIKQTGVLTADKPLLVILGPTGAGKTEASLAVAQALGGEIISADSRQIYREMDIGTAKIRPEETQGVPHHLLDVVDPNQTFSAAQFQTAATEIIDQIYERGNLPIVVGGTMLWIDALVQNYRFPEQTDPVKVTNENLPAKQAELKQLDPATYREIDINNPHRVARALALVKKTGQSLVKSQTKGVKPYHELMIGLTWPREELYQRLNQRVEDQIEAGLIEEVKDLLQHYQATDPGLTGIGYRQIIWYLRGDLTLDQAKEKLKQANRNYAKRQLTWWRPRQDIKWFDCGRYIE